MANLAKWFQASLPLRPQQRQQQNLFGELGRGTTQRREAIEHSLRNACALSRLATNEKAKESPFVHIAAFLEMLDAIDGREYPHMWSLRPRIYTLLRAIGALSYMNDFAAHKIYDISLPFDFQTLPGFLSDTAIRARFIATQGSVLTDARYLESSSADHMYFHGSAEDHIVPHRVLGHGGFGYVDLVISRLSTKPYARKRVARGRDSEENRKTQQYLVDEIRLMKTLRHRHLTKIIQSYSDYRYIGFLMEPIAECSLRQFVTKRPFPENQLTSLRQFFGCLAGGVNYLHQKRIRHRDLKLENILVRNASVYITDFGTAMGWTPAEGGTTQSRNVPVTHYYMSPEVDEKQSRNAASDMWSLGVVFLQMFTVLKGLTLSQWDDHLRKKADRLRREPWPCRNLEAVHEWMAVLARSHQNDWMDDPSLELLDNEPLAWIKSLLEHNQDARLSSKALVSSIADSPDLRRLACLDCADDFTDPHYRYDAGQDISRNTKNTIDTEVTAMVGAIADPPEEMDDRKAEMVTRWLGETQNHSSSSNEDEEPNPFPMPGAFKYWLEDEEVNVTQVPIPVPERQPTVSVAASKIPAGKIVQWPKRALHDSGFIIDHDESASDNDSTVNEYQGDDSSDLFPIVHDSSSENSDDLCPVDSPMLDQILEECEQSSTPEIVDSINNPADPLLDLRDSAVPEGRIVNQGSTRKQHGKEDTLTQNSPLLGRRSKCTDFGLGVETSITAVGSSIHIETGSERKSSSPSSNTVVDAGKAPAPAEESPLDHSMVKNLLKPPSLDKKRQRNRPVSQFKPKESMALPSLDQGPSKLPHLPKSPSSIDKPFRNKVHSPRPSAVDGLNVSAGPQPPVAPTDGKSTLKLIKEKPKGKESQPASTKLSAANVDRLNKQTKLTANKQTKLTNRPERRSFVDDNFTPAEFIEAAWRSAEAADSLATSVMSAASAKRFGGIKLLWDDKAYNYLEHYSRAGKAAAVRVLLDRGCNCGTRLKPRPRPLVLAIEGRSARHNKCVRALIKAGTDVNASYRGKTPIHRVLEQSFFPGYQKLLAMLLAAGAQMDTTDATDEYPLTKLFKGAAGDVPLEDYQKECLALVFHPKVPAVIDPNVRQPFTLDTPLHQAVRRRTAQAVALLVHRGADVNAKNASGMTPLLLAANQWRGPLSDQQERILYYILGAEGVDTDAKGGTLGWTALHHAAAAGCSVALDMLLERGASKAIRDKEGKDALAILEASRGEGKVPEDYQVMLDMLTS